MCGYYSNKYMSLVTRSTCTHQQNTTSVNLLRGMNTCFYGHFYGKIYGKRGACACSVYQAFLSPPLEGLGTRLIGMRMAACPFCARDKLLRSRRHEYAIFSHLQPNKRRVYKHGASMFYLRADSCISFVANGDSVTKLFTRKKAFLLDNIKDRSSIPRMHGPTDFSVKLAILSRVTLGTILRDYNLESL